jgi:hypothetical protein
VDFFFQFLGKLERFGGEFTAIERFINPHWPDPLSRKKMGSLERLDGTLHRDWSQEN